jgi:competence protein ComEC
LKKLSHIFIYNDFHLEGFLIFFFVLGFHHHSFFLIAFIYIICLKKKLKHKVYIPILIVLSLIFLYFNNNHQIESQIDDRVKIVEINKYEYYDLIKVKYENKYFNFKLRTNHYSVGDIVWLKGNIYPYRKNTYEFGFNQKNYYLSKNIYGSIEVTEHKYIESSFSIYKILETFEDYINQFQSKDYIFSFLFGKARFNQNDYQLYKELNILYLFTISGMHVYTLIYMIRKSLFYLNIKKNDQDIIIFIIYLILLYLNRFAHGVLRLFIYYLFYLLSQKFDIKFEKLYKINMTFLIILLLNFNLFYNIGFLMTYLILIFLSLMEFRYQTLSFYYKRLFISTLILLILLPFVNDISLLMIFILPLILFIITAPIYIMSLITILLPEFDSIFYNIIQIFNQLLALIHSYNLVITIPSLNLYLMILYYASLIFLLRSKNITILITRLLVIIVIYLIPIFNQIQSEKITFLDVSQGDSIIIESKNCVVVIDAYQNVLSYMKSNAIYEIDYLILTHSDHDHIKEASNLISNLKVKNVVLSYYDDEYPIYNTNILYLKADDQITCHKLSLNILAPLKKYDLKNNNSLVIQFLFDNQIFLLTGDIESKAESDIANYYKNKLKSDVLKVAHHGSNTSSTKLFLSYVKPSVVIISLGYNNQFDFPSKDVIDRLMTYNVMIYRTDLHGSIIYNQRKKNLKWKLYIPF